MILAIDTSSAMTSVALVDGMDVLASAAHVDARRHAEVLAPMVQRVIDDAGVTPRLIACGVGPGPYTGLRVGIATAQGLAAAWDIPVVGACSLDVLAAEAVHAGTVDAFTVASDARRREVYWARYDADGVRIDGPYVGRPSAIAGPCVGEGAHIHDLTPNPCPELRFPSAVMLGRLVGRLLEDGAVPTEPALALSAHGSDDGGTARALAGRRLLTATPLYVRRPDAVEAAEATR